MNNFIRSSSAIIPSAMITFFLFLGMYWLVSNNNQNHIASDDNMTIDFTPMKIDEQLHNIERIKPKEPEKPQKQPKVNLTMDTHMEKPTNPPIDIDIDTTTLTGSKFGVNIGTGNPNGDMTGDGGIITLVAIAPNYPRKALIAKIEGWVKVEFTITGSGSVINPKVVSSKPARIFNREALRAILKYRFKPKFVNGVATQQVATQTIEFKLDKD